MRICWASRPSYPQVALTTAPIPIPSLLTTPARRCSQWSLPVGIQFSGLESGDLIVSNRSIQIVLDTDGTVVQAERTALS